MIGLAVVPPLTLLSASLHRLELLRWRSAFGAALALLGIALSVRDAANAPLIYLGGLLAGSACIVESSVLLKLYPRSDPLSTNAVALTAGTAILLPLSFLAGEARTLPSGAGTWPAFAYLVVVGSILLFYLYVFVLQRWTASATSDSFLLFPLVTVFVAAWLAGEELSLSVLAGSAVVIVGVRIGAFTGR